MLATLRDAREAARLSQVELASKLDFTQSSVGKCERGERRLDILELIVWCEAIGLTPNDLVDELRAAILRSDAVQSDARKTVPKAVRRTARKTARKTLRKNGSRTV
jgi:transcriptional regulator with XRE-family HTH domain